ncbi:MAG: hypothetical protein HFI74_01310 [Lachnospiraceae bacterium]|jgi:hypothetical protein|nr:hypothetical protein [Lachnospiraceae bacterium]
MKKISVICVDCESDYIDSLLLGQTYQNLEVVEAQTGREFYYDIAEYIQASDSEYICFLEPGQRIKPEKIQKMLDYAEKMQGADVFFCNRNYMEEDGTILAHPDGMYGGTLKDNFYDGSQFLRVLLEEGNNLFGNLTTLMFRRDKIRLDTEYLRKYGLDENSSMQKAFLIFEILSDHRMAFLEEPLVDTYVENFNLARLRQNETFFEEKIQMFAKIHGWEEFKDAPAGISREHKMLLEEQIVENKGLKKEITFFALDKGEYYNLLPLVQEARERGYQVTYTENLDTEAEIGVYCQHFGRPQNAKFSVVLLHDMAQGHNRWPNLWELERWNIYDLGILPGLNWKDRWERCAFQYYVNPRCGAYMFGYPKSSEIFSEELQNRVSELEKNMIMEYDISVLYAPSWENDEKEDDFVRALASLPINLLIKQASWPQGYEPIVQNIADMRKMHEGNYKNLHYLEPEESILTALKMCDLVVSDESSVMMEALMFGKPSIAVTDWLIPDTVPSRFACIPFENVYKCKKVELRETVERLMAAGLENDRMVKNTEEIFANRENVKKDILDAIEYFTTGKGNKEFMKWKMAGRYMPANMWS